MNESELIDGCIRQDVDCQRILYETFARKMMGISLRYCNSRQEAEDVIQESFIKIFDKIKTFRNTGSLEAWIKRIVINSALKSNDKRVFKFEPGSLDQVAERQVRPDAVSQLATQEILELIQQLPGGYQSVFNLYAIEGYSHKEIGEMLGINEVTSRTQYARAKKYLQRLIQEKGIDRR